MTRFMAAVTIGGMIATVVVIICVATGAPIHRWEALLWLDCLFVWQACYLRRLP